MCLLVRQMVRVGEHPYKIQWEQPYYPVGYFWIIRMCGPVVEKLCIWCVHLYLVALLDRMPMPTQFRVV